MILFLMVDGLKVFLDKVFWKYFWKILFQMSISAVLAIWHILNQFYPTFLNV